MNELIKQALDEYFSDFKTYHLILLICFSLIIALIQIVQSIWLSRKIERFKGDLKKSEIKFSRYNELQISALRKIYHLLVTFHSSNNSIFKSKPNSIGHNKYKNLIKDWIQSYISCANEFSQEKILLTDDLKILISRTLKEFEEVKKILLNEKGELDHMEMEFQGDWNLMYEYNDNELDIISKKIGKIKEKDSIKNSEKHIIELRDKIESVFKSMNEK